MIKIKHLSVIGIILMMLPLTALADLRSFVMNEAAQLPMPLTDVAQSHPNYRAIALMVKNEIIKGYPDGTFKSDQTVNRAELMKMVSLAYVTFTPGAMASMIEGTTLYPLDATIFDDPKYVNCFSDVKDEWFARYICYAKEQGWVEGYPDGTFKPGQAVNRIEAMKIILNAMLPDGEWPTPIDAEKELPMPSDADMSQWYAPYLRFSIVKELIDGNHVTQDPDGSYYYKPADGMTRKEVAEMLFRMGIYNEERPYYAMLYSSMMCFKQENAALGEDAAYEAWLKYLDEQNAAQKDGMTTSQEEIDALYAKYSYDDVIQKVVDIFIADLCPAGDE